MGILRRRDETCIPETLLKGRYIASVWGSRREREEERTRESGVTRSGEENREQKMRERERENAMGIARMNSGGKGERGRERKREATCYGNRNGSLSAGLSLKRAINDAYTPWPQYDRGTARHKASSLLRWKCSVVNEVPFGTTAFDSCFCSSIVRIKRTGPRKQRAKQRVEKYASFEKDPYVDSFREYWVDVRDDSLAVLTVATRQRDRRFDDRFVAADRETMRWFLPNKLQNDVRLRAQRRFLKRCLLGR